MIELILIALKLEGLVVCYKMIIDKKIVIFYKYDIISLYF